MGAAYNSTVTSFVVGVARKKGYFDYFLFGAADFQGGLLIFYTRFSRCKFRTERKLIMIKEQKISNRITRKSFAKIDEALEMPNLIDVQKKSYQWFLKEGMQEVLRDVSPIKDHSENFCIEFVDFSIDETPKYPIEECKGEVSSALR